MSGHTDTRTHNIHALMLCTGVQTAACIHPAMLALGMLQGTAGVWSSVRLLRHARM